MRTLRFVPGRLGGRVAGGLALIIPLPILGRLRGLFDDEIADGLPVRNQHDVGHDAGDGGVPHDERHDQSREIEFEHVDEETAERNIDEPAAEKHGFGSELVPILGSDDAPGRHPEDQKNVADPHEGNGVIDHVLNDGHGGEPARDVVGDDEEDGGGEDPHEGGEIETFVGAEFGHVGSSFSQMEGDADGRRFLDSFGEGLEHLPDGADDAPDGHFGGADVGGEDEEDLPLSIGEKGTDGEGYALPGDVFHRG
mmetsp:Transcript_19275/g.43893  ORF Transcript_19275/g.43893 Transcript_19275/m.43893 type:complete len:253 (+) Transcript_19275:356-1114(+)